MKRCKIDSSDVKPWMIRCFPEYFCKQDSSSNASAQLKKTVLLERLKEYCLMDPKEYGQDVARLVHTYLLCSFFLVNSSTSIAWFVLEFVEEFEHICLFDWSSLIIELMNKQLAGTLTMKMSGCAMLIPVSNSLLIYVFQLYLSSAASNSFNSCNLQYWLCEHSNLMSRSHNNLIPRFLSRDLT